MGVSQSLTKSLPDIDSAHIEVMRHTKVLLEINSLTYEEFKNLLNEINALSRKCIDPNGKQLVFLVKHGTDSSLLWKATVKIACVKVDSQKRQIQSYKFLNLKQFLCVFKTFQLHLQSLVKSENQRNMRRDSQSALDEIDASSITNFPHLTNSMFTSSLGSSTCCDSDFNSLATSSCSHNDHIDECSICLDRTTEMILPCAHGFCTPCIEQWNVNNKTCPICCEILKSTDDAWIMSNTPGAEEISEEICAEFMNLIKEQ